MIRIATLWHAHDARIDRIDRKRFPLDSSRMQWTHLPSAPKGLLYASIIRWILKPAPPGTKSSTGLAAFSYNQRSHRAPSLISFQGLSASPHNQLPPPWSCLCDGYGRRLGGPRILFIVYVPSMRGILKSHCVSKYIVYASPPIALSCRVAASREAAREPRPVRPCVAYESALSSSSRLSNEGVGLESTQDGLIGRFDLVWSRRTGGF